MSKLRLSGRWSGFTCHTKNGELQGYHCNYPQSLPEEEKDDLFRLLYPVALSAFSRNHSSELEKDVWDHIFSSDGLLIVFDERGVSGKNVVAFRMWDIVWFDVLDGDILYLAGMCVKKEYQKIGIGSSLLKYVLYKNEQHRMRSVDQFCPLPECTYVALRTQSPVMKKCFDEAIGDISYPRESGESIPENIKKVASKIARHLNDDSFVPETLTSPNLYGGSLYGVTPCSEHDQYTSLFTSALNTADGDAMVCVWQRK